MHFREKRINCKTELLFCAKIENRQNNKSLLEFILQNAANPKQNRDPLQAGIKAIDVLTSTKCASRLQPEQNWLQFN